MQTIDYKSMISKNLIYLRKNRKLTQAELASYFNYSDKSISKWERAEGLPEVSVLIELALFFNVSLDDFVYKDMSQMPLKNLNKKHTVLSNIYLSLFALSIIWILTLIIYTTLRHRIPDYQASNVFIYALPISAITLFTLMTIRKLMIASLITLSVTSWTLLLSLTIVTRHFEGNYLLFIIGIPVQILIIVIYAYAILKKKRLKNVHRK